MTACCGPELVPSSYTNTESFHNDYLISYNNHVFVLYSGRRRCSPCPWRDVRRLCGAELVPLPARHTEPGGPGQARTHQPDAHVPQG